MDTVDGNAPLRWTLTRNAPLQALNTFHVQASAAQLLELHDAALLPDVLALPEVANGPLLVLGSGSNVLIAEDLPARYWCSATVTSVFLNTAPTMR